MKGLFRIRSLFAFLLGLGCVLAWGCQPAGVPQIDSAEAAQQALAQSVLPKINTTTSVVSDELALRYAVEPVEAPLPQVEDFPLYGAQPGSGVYLEIFSSSEKANVERQNER
ncbi:MAG: hypothetical protein F6J97_24195, partial [Leptolyngbya sp. SIO4C1]|nr:hypothetical protein [Leptolyngbya sp. SIO4C1]